MKKTIITFSLLIIALLILFQISKYSIFFENISIELVTTIVAVVFLVIGIYLNKRSLHKQTKNNLEIDLKKIEELEINKGNMKILQKNPRNKIMRDDKNI